MFTKFAVLDLNTTQLRLSFNKINFLQIRIICCLYLLFTSAGCGLVVLHELPLSSELIESAEINQLFGERYLFSLFFFIIKLLFL